MSSIFEKHPRPWTIDVDGYMARDTNERPVFTSPSFAYEELVPAIVTAVNAEPALRARVADLQEEDSRWAYRFVALQTDRDALRARVAVLEDALRDIVERTGIATPYDEHTYECDMRFDLECDCIVGSMGEIANAALAGGKGE